MSHIVLAVGKMYRTGCLLAMAMAVAMAAFMNTEVCAVVQHVVGDDRGWDPLSDFTGWSSTRTFLVGDNLWFAYSAAEQSLIEVNSQEELKACNISNPIRLYSGGLNTIRLTQVGSRYFTSGKVGSCEDGMKLHVNVQVSDQDNTKNKSNAKAGSSPALKDAVMAMVAAEGPSASGYGSPHTCSFSSMLILLSFLLLLLFRIV
eukprot:Gb_10173 [translate_table: standard]